MRACFQGNHLSVITVAKWTSTEPVAIICHCGRLPCYFSAAGGYRHVNDMPVVSMYQ